MDSITKGQRNLLLFLLGVAIIILPIRFIAVSNFNDKKTIDSNKEERLTYYNELKQKDANRQQYIDDTEKYTEEYEALLAEFPSELYQDNTIMYLQNVKDEYEFDFPSVSLGQETLFYTLGTGAAGDVTVDTATTTDETSTEVSLDSTETATGYNCYSASFPVSYEGDYKDIKDVIDYIKNGEYRMTLDNIDISYDEESGKYTGNMTITSYAVNGEDRTTDHADVDVEIGTTNIFGGSSSGSSRNSTSESATTEAQ